MDLFCLFWRFSTKMHRWLLFYIFWRNQILFTQFYCFLLCLPINILLVLNCEQFIKYSQINYFLNNVGIRNTNGCIIFITLIVLLELFIIVLILYLCLIYTTKNACINIIICHSRCPSVILFVLRIVSSALCYSLLYEYTI